MVKPCFVFLTHTAYPFPKKKVPQTQFLYTSDVVMIWIMRKRLKYYSVLLALCLLLCSCSNKGIHMSKHRKSRKCNCPTFSENFMANPNDNLYVNYGDDK